MKSTKAEVRKRVEEVFKLRLGGANFADIVQYASAPEQSWGVSERQVWNYIRAADKLIVERFDARAAYLLNRHLLQRNQLFAHAMGAGDFRTALAALQDEAKLEGLYPATRREFTGKDGGPIHTTVVLTDDERARAVATILARLGAGGAGPPGHGAGKPAGPAVGRPERHPDGGPDDPGPLADGVPRLFG
jgi:hypothetical protein